MDTLDHLADACLDASLVSEISDILAALANDDTGFLGGDNGAEGELGLGVFFIRLGCRFAVWSQPLVHLKVVHGVDKVAAVG